MSFNIAVLASGGGTNLQALLDAWRAGQFKDAHFVLVASNRAGAGALQRAEGVGVPTLFLDPDAYARPEAYDLALAEELKRRQVNLICLAGYLRILTPAFVSQFPQRIINIHPALLPCFGGTGMYGHHVHAAVLASGSKISGATVHFVDEGTDTGPIILQAVVPVMDSDTAETLAERVLIEEHRLYPRALTLLCEGRLKIAGRRVQIVEKA